MGMTAEIGMKRRGVLAGLASIAPALMLGLSGCQSGFTHHLRFRMTVEVMTPQGLRTGSAVYEITAASAYDPTLPNNRIIGGLRGQALVVDLPNGPLFVLLTRPNAMGNLEGPVVEVLDGSFPDSQQALIDAVARLSWRSRKAELPQSLFNPNPSGGPENDIWPIMVRFKDINNPKSVEQVDPSAIGVRRIRVETTRDDVTTGIEKRLRWLHKYRDWLEVGGADLGDRDFTTQTGE